MFRVRVSCFVAGEGCNKASQRRWPDKHLYKFTEKADLTCALLNLLQN